MLILNESKKNKNIDLRAFEPSFIEFCQQREIKIAFDFGGILLFLIVITGFDYGQWRGFEPGQEIKMI